MATPQIPPAPYGDAQSTQRWSDWYRQINLLLGEAFVWGNFNFAGSNLTDIETRNHYDLQNLQGGDGGNPGEYYHLTLDEHTKLTALVVGGGVDHGALFGLGDDDHTQYLLLAGRAGGQSYFGGTAATETLTLRGSTDADLGIVRLEGPMLVDYDFTDSPLASVIDFNPTIPASGGAIFGVVRNSSSITVDNALFISAMNLDQSTVEHVVNPGFAVATWSLAQPTYKTTTAAVNPIQSFILAAQPQFQNDGAGAGRTVSAFYAVSVGATLATTTSGDTLSMTTYTGVNMQPIWSTVAGSTIDFGTIRGVHMRNPIKGLFFPGAGVEGMTAYIGLEMDNITFGVAADVRAAVRSALNANTNNWFLLNNGTAQSDFGAGSIHLDDNVWVKWGNTAALPDVGLAWAAAESAMTFTTFWGVGGNPLYIQGTAADEWIFRHHSNDALDIGIGFDVNAVAFGTTLPTPNSNNWFVQFAGPNQRQVQIGGEYSDVLWTAGGSIDVNGMTVSDLQAFKINSPAVLLNGGTIDDISNLFVQAMPSFGATRTQALRVLGRERVDGVENRGSLQPAQITANQNDYQLGANNGQRTMNLLDSDGDYNITGIDSSFGFGQDGDHICLYNEGSFDLTLTHQDGASTAAYRFITPNGGDWVIHAGESCWIWYDDQGTDRWRVVDGTAHQDLIRTLHLSGDQFRKGSTAPTDVTIGTTPTIPALLFDATNELASLYHSHPADIDLTKDITLRIQFSLSSVETNGDTCDVTCDYTAPTLTTAEGIAKTSTQVTGQFTAVTGRLAVGDIYEMDITISAADATNPLANSVGVAFEIHLTNTTGVGDIHLIDGDFVYEAQY